MEWELAASLGSGASFGVTSGLRSAGGKPLHLCITAPLRRGFVLVTTDFLRSRDSVAIGNPPRFAWATPSRRFLPDCLRGQALRALPLSYPLADRLYGLHQHQG